MISTSAPSTEILVFLMSSFHIFPSSALISALGSMDLTAFSPSTNHSSLALALPTRATSKTTDASPMPPPKISCLHSFSYPFWSPVRRRSVAPTASSELHSGGTVSMRNLNNLLFSPPPFRYEA